MADFVGERGHVCGVDFSEARVRLASTDPRAHTHYVQSSLAQLPFSSGQFDYVLCRLVLEYVIDPMSVVRECVRVTNRGGRVVLADIDGYGASHYPVDDKAGEALAAIHAVLAQTGFDAYVGRKLFSFLRQAGCLTIRVHARPYHLIAGAADQVELDNWRYKLRTLAPIGYRILGRERYDRYVAEVLELLCDRDVFSYSTLIIAEGEVA
jgi:ubiquinone/menaquinone biosynthesis C-methylase UbiE